MGSSFSLVRYNNAVLIDKKTDTSSLAPTPTLGRKLDSVSYGVCEVLLQSQVYICNRCCSHFLRKTINITVKDGGGGGKLPLQLKLRGKPFSH